MRRTKLLRAQTILYVGLAVKGYTVECSEGKSLTKQSHARARNAFERTIATYLKPKHTNSILPFAQIAFQGTRRNSICRRLRGQ